MTKDVTMNENTVLAERIVDLLCKHCDADFNKEHAHGLVLGCLESSHPDELPLYPAADTPLARDLLENFDF